MAVSTEDLSRLVAEHTRPLLRGAMAMGFSEADAEELVQDTFVAYLDARSRFEGRSSVRTYLFGILYHKGAEFSRKRRRETGTEDIEAVFNTHFTGGGHWLAALPKGPEAEALSKELTEIIAGCAEKLSTDQKASFYLREMEGLSSEEICNALSVSNTNLRVLLFRARLRLRECLEKIWETR